MDAKLIEKLVPQELRDGYEFNRHGIVTSPGKFEGESIATLYYYDCFLNGEDTVFEVTEEEKQAFDIPPLDNFVYLQESNDGFVSLEYFTDEKSAEAYRDEEDETLFTYHVNLDERGEFYADVRNSQEETVFEIHGGQIFEDGFMKHKTDLFGLREYLVSLGIMQNADELRAG